MSKKLSILAWTCRPNGGSGGNFLLVLANIDGLPRMLLRGSRFERVFDSQHLTREFWEPFEIRSGPMIILDRFWTQLRPQPDPEKVQDSPLPNIPQYILPGHAECAKRLNMARPLRTQNHGGRCLSRPYKP